MVGKTLGHYEILEPLGAGGMGEVYRARDTNLERDVAIKVLPEDLATDAERLARFEREAKLLASLNHPNIAAIYGLEDEGDQRFIVMEVVEETLAERISRQGRFEVEKALDIARQIAEALEAAHDNGIIHRDLKPANVVVTPDGKAKVLDFGLAKSYEAEGSSSDVSPDLSHSPTMMEATRAGVILGTAAYMSPEQARGKPVDKRTDIFAFGALLYEMLTGRPAFDGETVTDVLASVVKEEPQWDALPPETPRIVRSLLRRCLGKDPTIRLHDIADARLEIEEGATSPDLNLSVGTTVTRQSPRWMRAVPWGLTALMALVTLVTVYELASLPTSPPPLVQQYIIRLNAGAPTHAPAQVTVSPDGRHVSYQANLGDGWRLYQRPIDEIDSRLIPGLGRDSYYPRFSPDGQWITFGREDKLWRVHASGGEPTMIHDFNVWKTWESNETILIGHRNSIWRIPATGARLEERELVAEPDPNSGIVGYGKPVMLPNTSGILVELQYGAEDAGTGIGAISFETGEVVTVAARGNDPRFSRSGHILYARETSIEAVPFSVEQFAVSGPAVPVLEGVAFNPGNGDSEYDVSDNGLLVFVPGQSITGDRRLAWVDRGGVEALVDDEARPFESARLSPDGTQLAVEVYDGGYSIWLYNLAASSWGRLTDEGFSWGPLWSPDGGDVLYTARKGPAGSPWGLIRKAADFSGEPEELATSSESVSLPPTSWSQDGREVVYFEFPSEQPRRIMVMPIEGDRTARPFLDPETTFDHDSPMVSPDGKWIAYVSYQSGEREVYVRPFPDGGARYQVSDSGGAEPMWSPDGKEIFYRDGTHMIAVQVETTPDFRVVGKEALFRDAYWHTLDWVYRSYDYDGRSKRFLMSDWAVDDVEWEAAAAADLHVIVNFFEVLNRLAPPER